MSLQTSCGSQPVCSANPPDIAYQERQTLRHQVSKTTLHLVWPRHTVPIYSFSRCLQISLSCNQSQSGELYCPCQTL